MVIYSYSGRWRKKNIFSKHNIIVFFAWRMGKHRQRRSTSAGRRPSRRMTAKESLRRPRNDLWILSAATNARRRTRGIILCKYNDATDGRRPVGENARDVDRAHEDRRNRKRVVGPAGACLRCLDRIRRTVDVTPCLNALDLRVLLAIRPRKNPSVHFRPAACHLGAATSSRRHLEIIIILTTMTSNVKRIRRLTNRRRPLVRK